MRALPEKYLNLTLLALGFGLGQGSLFLANTYLYWSGHYQLVADFGSANALVTLVIFVGDWGGTTYLAAASVSSDEDKSADRKYGALSVFRIILAIAYVAVLVLIWRGKGGLLTSYLVASAPGIVAQALSPVGLLDGRARSGLAGLSQALPFVAVAIVMPFCTPLKPDTAGSILGAITTLSSVVCIALQVRLARVKLAEFRQGFDLRRIVTVAVEATPYMLTPLPGHILFRGQIYLANAYLPEATLALFIYARQIIGVGYQAAGFYLRVDLRDFALWLLKARPSALQVLTQAGAVRLALALTIAILVAAPLLYPYRAELATAVAFYAFAIVTLTSSSTLQRVYLLTNRARTNVIVLTLSSALSLTYAYLFIDNRSISTLIICEIFAHVVQIFALACFMRSSDGRR